jgi:repressor LexA
MSIFGAIEMKLKPLTEKQAKFFRLLLHIRNRKGAPPTIRELQLAGRFSSSRSVVQFLDALEEAGYIARSEGARNIRVLQVLSEAAPERTRTVSVPLIGNVAAGTPILAVENVETRIPISERIARPPHQYFLLRVHGDSMDRAGIADGSLALIRQQETADQGDRVVALIDDEATIKRLKLTGEMAILEPVSSNPRHKPIVVDDEFRVQGVVVATIPDVTK